MSPHSTQKLSPQCSRTASALTVFERIHSVFERFHSTLAEIARCLKLEKKTNDTVELILRAAVEYNKTVHSVTRERPIEIVHSARLVKAQQDSIGRCNPTPGERVFVKNNKRLGNKLTPVCTEQKVQADLGTSVLIKGRVVHKDNLK